MEIRKVVMVEDSFEIRRKRLLYRGNHRGMQEMDVLLGSFITRNLNNLSDDDIALLEDLLDETDVDLFDWITGKQAVPPALDNDVMRQLQTFSEKLSNP